MRNLGVEGVVGNIENHTEAVTEPDLFNFKVAVHQFEFTTEMCDLLAIIL